MLIVNPLRVVLLAASIQFWALIGKFSWGWAGGGRDYGGLVDFDWSAEQI